MSLDTDFNQSPYYDDFDEEKNFHRVLFKPGVAVQARELTQLQTILQNQVERFGNNIIREGSIIQGCNFVEVKNVYYVKILDLQTNGQPVSMSSYLTARAVGVTTGVTAVVDLVSTGLESQTPDLNTLYVKYLTTGTSGQKTFSSTENIEIRNFLSGEVLATVTAAGLVDTSSTGRSYGVRVGDGIIYQKGHFVRVDPQYIIISKYNSTPDDLVIGFRTDESIVTSTADTSLLDNANGFNNYNAPGADRLKLTATLFSQTTAAAREDEKFFAIQEYDRGKVVRRNRTTQYAAIQSMMEQRTVEESGNYTVKAFPLSTSTHPTDTTLVSLGIGAGVAYVEGKRVELTDTLYLDLDKADTTATQEGQSITTNIGHYVRVNEFLGNFDTNIAASVSLRDGTLGSATAGAVSVGATNEIGTAKVRAVTYESGTPGTAAAVYRLYIFDIKMNSTKSWSSVESIYYNGAVDGGADLISTSIIDSTFKRSYFSVGRTGIASLPAATTSADYVYRTVNSGLTLAQNSTSLTITLSGDAWPTTGTLSTDQRNEIILIPQSTQSPYVLGKPINLSGATATVAGSTLTISGLTAATGGNVNITAHYNVKKTISAPASKDLLTVYMTINCASHSATTNGPYALGWPDVYSIENVYVGTTYSESNTDRKSYFVLNNGQKDAFYGLSTIVKQKGLTLTSSNRILVKAKVFKKNTSTADGVFTVNSYPIDDANTANTSAIQTQSIPIYKNESGELVNLRDVVDFRPYVSNTAAYSTTTGGATNNPSATNAFGSSELYIPTPSKEFEADYSYYMARKDLLTIDRNGNFIIVSGDPADTPVPPTTPSTGMVLSTINIPVYPSLPRLVADKINRPDLGISLIKKDQRRYTMKDISDIAGRVSRIEYYTALNALESKTKDKLVTDGSGNNRFKNGIFVDNFEDLSGANIQDLNFAAGNDPSRKEITPKFQAYHMELSTTDTGNWSNIEDHGAVLSLDKNSTPAFITQPYSSQYRNCVTDFYKFSGNMHLSPSYDSGYNSVQAPAVNFEIDLTTPFVQFAEELANFVPLSNPSDPQTNTEILNVDRNRGVFGTTTTTTTQTSITTTTTELQVNYGESVLQNVGNYVTDVRFSPFMRSIQVNVSITGLRPNTEHYPFFDGKDISASCAPLGTVTLDNAGYIVPPAQANYKPIKAWGSALTSDSSGTINFAFIIPEETFHVGDRTLEIVDVDDLTSIEAATSYAKAVYSAFNYSVQSNALNITTRPPEITTTSTSSTERLTPVTRTTGSDPIAQTFVVDPNKTGDSVVMVDSIKIYFEKKSTTSGVTVQIRSTENGYPSSAIFAKAYKAAADVNVSADASSATTFTFAKPVPLKAGVEYCFVIKPDANSPDYRVWVAKTGGTDITTGLAITSDSHDGTLFTSTNDRAWTAYQDENIKFTLYAAKYKASGYAYLTNDNHEFLTVDTISGGNFTVGERAFIMNANTNGTAVLNANSTTITGTGLDIFNVGDHIAVYANTTVIDTLYVTAVANATNITVANEPISSNTSTKYFKTIVGNVSLFDRNDPGKLYLDRSTAKTGTYTYTDYSSGSTTAENYIVAGKTIRGEVSGVTANITSVDNFKASYIQPNIYNTNYTYTTVTMYANTLTSDSSGTNYVTSATGVPLALNDNTYLNKTATIIKSRSNEIVDGTGKSFKVRVNLNNSQSGTKDATPIVDWGISNMAIYEYIVNNVVNDGDTNELQGSVLTPADSKYITKTITLADGFDANDLKVYLTAYKSPSTNIKVYARFQNDTDTRTFSEIEWTELSLVDNAFSSTADRYDYREFEYAVPEQASGSFTSGGGAALNTSNDNILRYIDTDGAIHDTYKIFAIKVVLLATSHKDVPRLRDIRAIALT